MFVLSEKTRDIVGFGTLLVLWAALLWLPHQIPKEIEGDFPADVYPKALFLVGALLLVLQFAFLLVSDKGEKLSLSKEGLTRTLALFAIMIVGYFIVLTFGFLLAGAFFVFSFAWLLDERGKSKLIAATLTPVIVYAGLEYGFDIRLPSILDAL